MLCSCATIALANNLLFHGRRMYLMNIKELGAICGCNVPEIGTSRKKKLYYKMRLKL